MTYRGNSLIRNRPPPRNLEESYVKGPIVVLGEWGLPMSEEPFPGEIVENRKEKWGKRLQPSPGIGKKRLL